MSTDDQPIIERVGWNLETVIYVSLGIGLPIHFLGRWLDLDAVSVFGSVVMFPGALILLAGFTLIPVGIAIEIVQWVKRRAKKSDES